MKRYRFVMVLMWMTFCSPFSFAASPVLTPKEAETRVSMDLKDANIKDVLKIFSQQAGLNFVASEQIQDKTVTLYLDHVTVQDALSNIISANSLEYVRVPGSEIFLVRPLQVEPKNDLMMKVYHLKYARVSNSPLEAAASLSTYQAALRTSGITAAGGSSGQSAGGGISGGSSGYSPSSGGGSGGGGGETTTKRGIDIVLRDLLSERGSLVTDPRTNSVIITDLSTRFKFFEEAIAKLDRPVNQVMIEAEILETSVNALDNLGIKWGSTTGELASFSGPKRTTTFPLSNVENSLKSAEATITVGTLSLDELDVVLQLLKTDTDTEVLSRPRIMTMDNEGAVIHITAETALASLTTATTVNGTALSSVGQAERRTTGISLRVTPQINDDHYVTMTLEPSVVRAEKSEFFPTQFVDPQQRSAQTTVMVRDGETIAIGGLVSKDKKNAKRKVPILGDIPLLGLAFRNTEKTLVDRELLVFVTPHIIKHSEVPITEGMQTASQPVTVTVPEEEREQLPPRSKEKEVEEVLDRLSSKP